MKKENRRFGVPYDAGDGITKTYFPYDHQFELYGKYRYARNWGSYPVKFPEGGYVVEQMDLETGQMMKVLYLNVPDEIRDLLFDTDKKEFKAQRDQDEHSDRRDQDSRKDADGNWHLGSQDQAAYEAYVQEQNQPDEEESYDEAMLRGALSDNPKIRNAQVRYMCEVIRKVLPRLTKKNYKTFYQIFYQCMKEVDIAEDEGVGKSAITNRKNRLIASVVPVFENLGFPIPTKAELKAEKKAAEQRIAAMEKQEQVRRAEEREVRLIRGLTEVFYHEGLMDKETMELIRDEIDEAA